jgi:tetratricopeptide (TPR) repeat protein
MLFDAGRYSEAAAAYKRALAFAPNRSAALFGLALSEHRSKNYAASDSAYARLRANWSHADAAVVGQIPRPPAR